MSVMKKLRLGCLWAILGLFLLTSSGWGYEINDKLSIGGIIAGEWQYQSLKDDYTSGGQNFESAGRGALVFQPEISFAPTESDEIFAKFGFGAGNGLSAGGQSPFVLATWAADVQDDYKNINDRNRDYLLTAWYKHTFEFSEDHTLGLTGGIIDACDYMDENAFANDEFSQFMNEALVNGPNAFLPSYDIGGAIEWEISGFSIKGVAMAMGTNDEQPAEPYNFYGIQFGYNVDFGLGEGNYRLILDTTSDDFSNVAGTKMERMTAALISFDQQLGDIVGLWLRFGWQDDDPAIVYKDVYTGGVNISGNLWGREQDNIGIGYGHLRGGNVEIDKTDVFEIYGRFALNDIFSITGDIQYMKDSYKVGGVDPSGWIFGLRATAEF